MKSYPIALGGLFLLLGYGFWQSPSFKDLAAGVAIFLFGMTFLGEGFKAFTGGTLERVLQRSTDRRWKSVLFGAVTTAIVQSSTLVSVITISFLSAGMLGLAQGIGIVFGANVGTTTGAWLIAGFGLKVDIAAYALPMITFGVILVFTKSKVLKGLGYILSGLGFLFLGIHYIKVGFDAFKDTIDLAAYAVDGVKGLLLYTLIGIIVTMIVQSSHATLALTIAALAAQQISYENALALAVGAHIGTTSTAIIGALGANVEGRRLAAAHFIFNVVTSVVILILMPQFIALVEWLSNLAHIAAHDYTLKLAVFHTVFSLVGLFVMLPLTDRLVHFLETWLKPPQRTVITPKYIHDSMLEHPQAGLEAARKELLHLFDNTFEVMSLVLHADPVRLRKGEDLELLANAPERVRVIDVDDYYLRRIKPLHGVILDFLAHLNTSGPQSRQAFALRTASQSLLEALKDLKHLQKNLVPNLASPNPYLRKEYVAIRQRLALMLHTLQTLPERSPTDITMELDVLRASLQSHDIVANGKLDELIRERRINVESATSLMNDSAYAYNITSNLVDMAQALFTPLEEVHREIEHELHLNPDEIQEMLAPNPGDASQPRGLTP